MPLWIKDKLFQKKLLIDELKKIDTKVNWKDKIFFSEHHISHAASAFFPSPFKEASVLTMDGVGEWSTSSIAIGNGKDLNIEKEINFPHLVSLYYFYTFGEYKLSYLANPKYVSKIRDNLIHILDDGSFNLDISYFDYCTGLTMTNKSFMTFVSKK